MLGQSPIHLLSALTRLEDLKTYGAVRSRLASRCVLHMFFLQELAVCRQRQGMMSCAALQYILRALLPVRSALALGIGIGRHSMSARSSLGPATLMGCSA